MSRDQALRHQARALGIDPAAPMPVGGRYSPTVRHGDQIHVSGQLPRVGDQIAVVGRAGEDVTLEQAQHAARICAVRALAFVQRSLGTLEALQTLLKLTVYVRCSESFTLHSEVADAASDLLVSVLGEAGHHTRTSVGVLQLPKGATVELDLLAAVSPGS